MASNYTDLKQAVLNIADRVAAIGETASSPHEVVIYVELHKSLMDSAGKLINQEPYLQTVLEPASVASLMADAAWARKTIEMDADLGAISLGVGRLVASISALPGQSTTGGGGPI